MTRHNKRRCVLPCCHTPNPATACGHWKCGTDYCDALTVYTSTDHTTPGFTHPEENDA